MVLCPVAMAVGCSKCPIVKVCPLKTSLGDFKAEAPPAAGRSAARTVAKPASRKTAGKTASKSASKKR